MTPPTQAQRQQLFDQWKKFAVWKAKLALNDPQKQAILRMTGHTEDDVIQIALMKVWDATELWDAGRGGSFGSYAGTAIWRGIGLFLQRGRRIGAQFPDGDELPIEDYRQPNHEEEHGQRIAAAVAEAAMKTIPGRHRTVMQLRADGLTLREVGRQIGASPERARQIIIRAKRDMTRRIRQFGLRVLCPDCGALLRCQGDPLAGAEWGCPRCVGVACQEVRAAA